MRCRSATRRSSGFLFAACRIRSASCDRLPRFCARLLLRPPEFPSAPALGSTCSAGRCRLLFTGFIATMAEPDFFRSLISVYGLPPLRCGPARLRGNLKTSRVPIKCFCTCHGSSTPGCPTSPHQIGLWVLPSTGMIVSAHPVNMISRLNSPAHTLPTLHQPPHGIRRTARGESGG